MASSPIFPAINASLNGLAAIFLFLGWRAIRAKQSQIHQKYMAAALTASALFLCSYIAYHILIQGVTKYPHQGIARVIYFFILCTHTQLAVIILPFSILAVRHAIKKDFIKHTRITRWLLPVWMYVSLTGVLIYLMLYVF